MQHLMLLADMLYCCIYCCIYNDIYKMLHLINVAITLRQDFLRWLINSSVVSPAVWLSGDFFLAGSAQLAVGGLFWLAVGGLSFPAFRFAQRDFNLEQTAILPIGLEQNSNKRGES